MGNVNYDWMEAISRLANAGKRLDKRWAEILVYHAALEIELDVMLEKTLKRGDAVTGSSPRFSFGHKVAILKAAWQGKPADADLLCDILFRFNELRNAVAHPDRKKTITELRNLQTAYARLVPDLGHVPDVGEIAQGACAFMGDGVPPHALRDIKDGLGSRANEDMPDAVRAKPSPQAGSALAAAADRKPAQYGTSAASDHAQNPRV